MYKVLIVDDEPIICRGAESMIRDAAPEAQIDCFTDPFQAWEHLQQEPADVVFLDIEIFIILNLQNNMYLLN